MNKITPVTEGFSQKEKFVLMPYFKGDFFDVLAKFLTLVPKRNNNDRGYNERDR